MTTPADYPWSSYPAYATGHPGIIALTRTPSYEALGLTPTVRQDAYRRFVETPQPYDRAIQRKLSAVTAYA